METKIVTIGGADAPDDVQRKLAEAGALIRRGGLVAFPTETVYGLGGDALSPESSKKIYEAKGRPCDNPLIVHIADMGRLGAIVEAVPEKARLLAKAFWPGPLTMIFKKSALVPPQTTGGLDTVAVRMPDHKIAADFIRYAGGYVAAPSANISGKPSPTLARHVIEDMDGRIDMVIDAGGVEIGLESTIVDVTSDVPVILRPGYITQAMLSKVVGETDMDAAIYDSDCTQAPKAPGMKYRHYAPKGELVIVEGEARNVVNYINAQAALHGAAGASVGIIGTRGNIPLYRAASVKNAGSRSDFKYVARRLYTFLREFDDENVAYIYSESFDGAFDDGGFGQAVMNRLLKAAGHRVVRV